MSEGKNRNDSMQIKRALLENIANQIINETMLPSDFHLFTTKP